MSRPLWLFLSLLGLASCAGPAHKPVEPDASTPHVKVMTFNVNYGIAGDSETIAAIADEDADVVMLQETTEAWERSLRVALSERYPHMEFRHCCGAGGLAIMSKAPFETLDYMKAPEPGWFPAWRARVMTPIGAIQVLNVHLRPPVSDSGSFVKGYFESGSIHETEMAAYREALDENIPTLIAGDFNESSGPCIEQLSEDGWPSALVDFAPSQATWRWPTSFGEVTQRLDHIVYSGGLLRPLNAYVLEKGNSDHFPVVALFEPKGL